MIWSYLAVGVAFIPGATLYALYGQTRWALAVFALAFGMLCADKAWRLTKPFRNQGD